MMVAIIARQPATVAEALKIPGVGRSAARRLLSLGLITDSAGAMNRNPSTAA